MMNVSQKTQFEKLFKEKKFYDFSNPIYQGWLGFMIATLCSEENVFDNILAAKTITEIPRTKKRRVDAEEKKKEKPRKRKKKSRFKRSEGKEKRKSLFRWLRRSCRSQES